MALASSRGGSRGGAQAHWPAPNQLGKGATGSRKGSFDSILELLSVGLSRELAAQARVLDILNLAPITLAYRHVASTCSEAGKHKGAFAQERNQTSLTSLPQVLRQTKI